MQPHHARASFGSGFLLQELLVMLAVALSGALLATLLVAREKRRLAAHYQVQYQSLRETLILHLLLRDIASARSAWVDEESGIWVDLSADEKSKTARWAYEAKGLTRRVYRGGKRTHTDCYGSVLLSLRARPEGNGLISLVWKNGKLLRLRVGGASE